MTEKNTPKKPDVTLSEPIKIDGKDVTGIDLRKPMPGELRGLKLTDILQMDASAMQKLLPRITQPPMSETQVARVDPADFLELCTKTVRFFVEKSQLQGLGLETDL